jgi:hypothetical protein
MAGIGSRERPVRVLAVERKCLREVREWTFMAYGLKVSD